MTRATGQREAAHSDSAYRRLVTGQREGGGGWDRVGTDREKERKRERERYIYIYREREIPTHTHTHTHTPNKRTATAPVTGAFVTGHIITALGA